MTSWMYTSEASAECPHEPPGWGHNTRDGFTCEACGAVALDLLRSEYARMASRLAVVDQQLSDANITIRTLIGLTSGDA